ncbi:hypothetical protein MPUL_10500 [Mycolicibacterium pulveris]|uniref:Uncharacterized protein n=1 Tax=Mycolicibacterium pulveris TaxID=36813 RepID=A0A7I7UEY4_MYCPV|nr:hypothetical protein [Mycolicibacterium pulveris]BBY79892.1 hypothetical protein MPUL_10500 [Mycolicibacterium pulveris]
MRKVVKNAAAGALMGGSLLFTAGLGVATAQPDATQTDRVNVAIGTAGVLEDVSVTDAAQIAAALCDVEVSQVNSVVESVVTNGDEQVVCTNNLGSVNIQRGGPGQSENAPGQTESTPGQAESAPGAAEVPAAEAPAAEQPAEGQN